MLSSGVYQIIVNRILSSFRDILPSRESGSFRLLLYFLRYSACKNCSSWLKLVCIFIHCTNEQKCEQWSLQTKLRYFFALYSTGIQVTFNVNYLAQVKSILCCIITAMIAWPLKIFISIEELPSRWYSLCRGHKSGLLAYYFWSETCNLENHMQ